MTNTNPLAVYGFIVITIILLALTWRTIRSMWAAHGSVATLRKRQLVQAQKDELLYAQAAEYYTALATGARQTVDRLSGPTYTPGPHTEAITVVSVGGGAGGSAP